MAPGSSSYGLDPESQAPASPGGLHIQGQPKMFITKYTCDSSFVYPPSSWGKLKERNRSFLTKMSLTGLAI
jgi:hypothetical protein